MKIGIMAPSAPCGQVELQMGKKRLEAAGFEVFVHPQTKLKSDFFAGTDEARASALFDLATDDSIDVIWAARGGYGAFRMLQVLDRLFKEKGFPKTKKTLVGYSDVTAIHAYAQDRLGWRTLHAWMPGTRDFSLMKEADFKTTLRAIESGPQYLRTSGFEKISLKWLDQSLRPKAPIEARIVGGNLMVWLSLFGTPLQPASAEGKILFLEDVDEAPYRLDRIVRQLVAMGAFKGVKAVVLGTMTGFEDRVYQVLATPGEAAKKKPKMKPLRPKLSFKAALDVVFKPVVEMGIPVAYGLPVGHGSGSLPMPLGGLIKISDSKIQILEF